MKNPCENGDTGMMGKCTCGHNEDEHRKIIVGPRTCERCLCPGFDRDNNSNPCDICAAHDVDCGEDMTHHKSECPPYQFYLGYQEGLAEGQRLKEQEIANRLCQPSNPLD